MMQVLICPDKFKGSLSASDVCAAVTEGLLRKGQRLEVRSLPLADGGEGTCEILTRNSGGHLVPVTVTGPLFTPVIAHYGISGDKKTAFVEMAKASGLALVAPESQDPLRTTSYGTGELIRHAIEAGISQVVLGIGGSATTDAGIGMAAALGFEFLDVGGSALTPAGGSLTRLHSISSRNVVPGLSRTRFTTLCDVVNPLHGGNGAAYVYGPQKGAGKEAVLQLDEGLRNFENVVRDCLGKESDFPSAGAAGGLGAGARVFLDSVMERGFSFVIRTTGLKSLVSNADLIITGEGKLDEQSLHGKVVMEVARIAKDHGKPVIVLCGKNEIDEGLLARAGIRQVISLVDGMVTPAAAMARAFDLVAEKTFQQMVLNADARLH